MPFWMILSGFLILAGALFSENQNTQERLQLDRDAQSIAGSMLIYRRALAQFAENNSSPQGQISSVQLNLPAWYVQDTRISGFVLAGKPVVVFAGNAPGLIGQIREATQGGVPVGLVRNNQLIDSNTGQVANVALPSGTNSDVVIGQY